MMPEDWSPEAIRSKIQQTLAEDPQDENRRLQQARREREKAARVANAHDRRISTLRQDLMTDVPANVIEARLTERGEAAGTTLAAQWTRKQIEERYRYAKEMLGEEVPDSGLRSVWQKHVDGLHLPLREKVRYEAESVGQQLDDEALNDAEARRKIASLGDGIRGLSYTQIDRYIEIAKQNGHWPLPELHTGPGSRPMPRGYGESDFIKACNSPLRSASATGQDLHALDASADVAAKRPQYTLFPKVRPIHQIAAEAGVARRQPTMADVAARPTEMDARDAINVPTSGRTTGFRARIKALLRPLLDHLPGLSRSAPAEPRDATVGHRANDRRDGTAVLHLREQARPTSQGADRSDPQDDGIRSATLSARAERSRPRTTSEHVTQDPGSSARTGLINARVREERTASFSL